MVDATVDKPTAQLHWRELPSPIVGCSCVAPADLPAGEDALFLYRIPLVVSSEELSQLKSVLSQEEITAAARFHFERHSRRYIVCRGTLRCVLSAYLDIPPARITFQYGPQGKPHLAEVMNRKITGTIEFNLSHSDELALIAISQSKSVGVDLERVRKLDDFDVLVARFFSGPESEAFSALPGPEKPRAFFHLWTRKEALLKATGHGIGQFLNQVEVSFLPAEKPQIRSLPPPFGHIEDWELQHLDLDHDYVGAVAIRSSESQ